MPRFILPLLLALWAGFAVAGGDCSRSYAELSAKAAERAGLHYVRAGAEAGITRRKQGDGFVYFSAAGSEIRDAAELSRIRALRLPPGYRDVWISSDPESHIQATGLDERGRTQYRYHPQWQRARAEAKFSRMEEFGAALPALRERVERDISAPGLGRERVLAAATRFLDGTYIRVGNEEYARENASYGLTTLRRQHVTVSGGRIMLEFRGKSGQDQRKVLEDQAVATVIGELRRQKGDRIFQYTAEGGRSRPIESADVNDYIASATGGRFTAKDFRTWGANVMLAQHLSSLPPATTAKEIESNLRDAIAYAAAKLGNTPSVCEKNYLNPSLIEAYRQRQAAFAPGADPERLVLEILGSRAP